MRARRQTPRRRDAPRWTPDQWTDATLAMLRRSGSRCECCGDDLRGRAERHHRIRRRDGGDRLANLLLLLPEHHAFWTVHPEAAADRGIIVPTWEDIETAPVLHRGRQWVVLDDEGYVTKADPRPVPDGPRPPR